MRTNPITLITFLLLSSFCLKAQDSTHFSLLLQSGAFIPAKNITAEQIASMEQKTATMMGKKYLVLQFEHILSEAEKKALEESGIKLLEYIPNNAYTAIISGNINVAALYKAKARSIFNLSPLQKMDRHLAAANFPEWAVKTAGTIDILASFAKSFSIEEIKRALHFTCILPFKTFSFRNSGYSPKSF